MSPRKQATSTDLTLEELLCSTERAWERGSDALAQALEVLSRDALRILKEEQVTPVRSVVAPEGLSEALALPAHPGSLAEVQERVTQLLLSAPSTSGRRFFNQLFAGHDPIGTPTDMLASLVNHSMYTYKVGGPLIVMEEVVLRGLRRLAGFPEDGGGIFTPGGSLSNLSAMLCARDRFAPSAKEEGTPKGLTLYCSEESHYSVKKGAGIVGFGRSSVRAVPTDERGVMRSDALLEMIQADRRAGSQPMMIIATAGTTVLGAFDDLEATAEVARSEGLWLHVDGAFGGTALWSDALRGLCAGLERADSFTWDAHKAMGLPLTCSALLTRDPHAPARALSEQASYLFQSGADLLNPGTRSLQCGRRNDALKLWAAWQYHGDDGWTARTDRLWALAQTLTALIKRRPQLELLMEPQYLNVSFEYRGRSSVSICERLERERRALVGYAYAKGRCVIRVAVVNPELTRADLEALLDEVEAVAPHCKPASA